MATEDMYSYSRSPLPKHRTPPSVTLSNHHRGGPTGSTGQTGIANHHKEKVLMNGHSQHTHLGTQNAQTSAICHSAIQRRATEVNSREMSQLGYRGSSTTLSSSAHLAGSHSSISHIPSSSPELVESGHSSEQLKRRKGHKSVLTEHQYSSSPNFFSGSNDNLGSSSISGSSSLMKLSERQDSSLSLVSVASLTRSSGALAAMGGDDCKQEAAVMDLYILKQSSDFYHQLCVAWVNVKIVSVLCSLAIILLLLD